MTKKLRVHKNVICNECKGRGGKDGATSTCKDCNGRGVRVQIRQLGPGMIQQMQSTCDTCIGEGSVIAERDRCQTCHGAKVVKEKKTLEVYVTKGMKNGEKIMFRGEADEAPNTIPGDVIVVLQMTSHPVFKREGQHLFMKKRITLQESLCGFQFDIHHLDGRILRVKSSEGTVCKPGSYKRIKDEGMPNVKNPYSHGNLYVEFEVEFPKYIDAKVRRMLKDLLPATSDSMDTEHPARVAGDSQPVEEVSPVDVDIEDERRSMEESQQRESYEEEEERPSRNGQTAQCRTQ